MTNTYEYYLAYKTKEFCFKHVKISDIDVTNKYDTIFDTKKNGDPLHDDEFKTFVGTSGTSGTSGKPSDHSIYILQKTIPSIPSTPDCKTIFIRLINTNNTSELEKLINDGIDVKLEQLKVGVVMGGGSPPSPKRKSPYGGSTMKNRIKKNKNNYKNKQKSNTRKN
jgi:hypothetical protein